MILGLVLIFSFLACCLRFWFILKNGSYSNRRQLTGCEISRFVLDAHGQHHVTIDRIPEKTGEFGPSSVRRVLLNPACFEGRSLLDIAQSSREAVFSVRAPKSLFLFELRKHIWSVLAWLILFAWAALFAAFLKPSVEVLRAAGLSVFTFSLMVALLDLRTEWEVSDQAFRTLVDSRYFEVDELARLKRLFKGLRLNGVALIFRAPWVVISALAQKVSRRVGV